MAEQRAHDIVVFGATGFTGALVAEYLATHAGANTRWAIAGRDERKLYALRERLSDGRCPPRDAILADVSNPTSLEKMSQSAQVVLTTVGPYAKYGEPVLEAAVNAGSDYVDITGEPAFVRRSIERFDSTARERGLRVVHCCGFDSVPHDLGALFTAEQLPRGVPMTIEGFVRSRGTFSGGTWHSAIHAFGTALTDRPKKNDSIRRLGERRARALPVRVRWVREVESWAVPLPTIDPMIVLRSARALDVYGPDFRYGHYARVRKLRTAVGAVVGVGGIVALAQVPPLRSLLLRVKQPGDGPTPEQRARSWFEVTFVGEAESHRVVTTVSGSDPGYGETAKMVAESALCLALDRTILPRASGVITPAIAMGTRLRERLQEAGIRFQVRERI